MNIYFTKLVLREIKYIDTNLCLNLNIVFKKNCLLKNLIPLKTLVLRGIKYINTNLLFKFKFCILKKFAFQKI
jgi:hypothetical protein